MRGRIILTTGDIVSRITRLADTFPATHNQYVQVYGVPRGGVPMTYLVAKILNCLVVDSPEDAHVLVDDVIDSGATRDRYAQQFSGKPFWSPYDKTTDPTLGWLVFPWEGDAESSVEDVVVRLLQFIGEDPTRDGLRDTPRRFIRAWGEYTSGYGQDPETVLRTFEISGIDQMIVVNNIAFVSKCEHHLADITGYVDVAYIPNRGRIVGLSKLARVVDIFTRRLQVQERLTDQLADAFYKSPTLAPRGVGVVVRASHACMSGRGVRAIGAMTTTSALRGVFLEKPEVRGEFLSLSHATLPGR